MSKPLLPIVEEITESLPILQAAQRLAALPHLLILDSAKFHPEHGRYSFLSADPFDWLSLHYEDFLRVDPFQWITQNLHRYSSPKAVHLPPFQGGIAGLFGYGLSHAIESLPVPPRNEFNLSDIALGVYDWVIAWDHLQQRTYLIATGFPELEIQPRERKAVRRIQQIRSLLNSNPTNPHDLSSRPLIKNQLNRDVLAPLYLLSGFEQVWSNFSQNQFQKIIQKGIDYIHAGDCFQVNLAQRLLAPLKQSPLELYQHLRERNPAPYAGYFDTGEAIIASASPECFLRVVDREMITRPIKGTRPRGKTPEEDQLLIHDLLTNPKDRAENVMIVDLLRNDLGKVSDYGSIAVPKVCQLESHPFVHHLVSEVRGRLRQDKTLADLIRASFPGGSITGAPKVRAMEIITELEQTARGAYCGSLGYLSFDGSMDTNLLIRTFTIAQGWAQFPVGGGIVADSDPVMEYEETKDKAKGLLEALR